MDADPLDLIFKRFLLHTIDAKYPSNFPPPQKKNMKTLIFDLDETLVHSSENAPNSNIQYFKVGNPPFYVQKRPGLDDFMKKYSKLFDIFIFTSSDKTYADSIINVICPFVDSSHRLYRSSCSVENNVIHKDLNAFKRPDNSIILIDDNFALKKFHPNNTIIVQKWNGTQRDSTLTKWLPSILDQCLKSDDVRSVIKRIL